MFPFFKPFVLCLGLGVISLTASAQSLPTLSVADVSAKEGSYDSSSNRVAKFTLTLSQAATTPVVVKYSTLAGTAVAGQDYTPVTSQVTIASGKTKASIEVSLEEDSIDELDETFTLKLDQVTGATVARAAATGTILDDDAVLLQVQPGGIVEGQSGEKAMTIRFERIGFFGSLPPVERPILLTYATSDGSATAGSDYRAVQGSVTIEPGQTSQTITIPIIGDTVKESDESIRLIVQSPGSRLGNANSLHIIFDDDNAAPSGRIYYASSYGWDKNSTIYSIKANGTGRKALTDGQSNNYEPILSPDGRKIAFISDRDLGADFLRGNNIHVMNVDGSGVQRITTDGNYLGSLSWSPDGSKLVFEGNADISANGEESSSTQVFVVGADGTGLRRVTDSINGSESVKPQFRANSTQIVYVRSAYTKNDYSESLMITTLDGSKSRMIATQFEIYKFALSPDGNYVVFESFKDQGGLYLFGLTRPEKKFLDISGINGKAFHFSRDSSRLFYVGEQDLQGRPGGLYSLTIADGKKLLLCQNYRYSFEEFSESPDGKYLVAGLNGQEQLGTIPTKGGYWRPIPNAVGVDASWGPNVPSPTPQAPSPSGNAS